MNFISWLSGGLGAIAVFIVLLLLLTTMLFIVKQQTVFVIERFGKYRRTCDAGIHIRLPFGIDRIVAKIPLRVRQDNIEVETKTKDNVFVQLQLAVQFRVGENSVSDAYYKLQEPIYQIRSYIEDAIRSAVPLLSLDETFEKKDEIAVEVLKTVQEEMSGYGYIIVKTLITSIEPDAEVKNSMNEINAAQRKRVAAQELANADKIRIVIAAEAEAEKDRLHGVGIANQRKAIVDGLASSFKEFEHSDLSEDNIMSILLTNQWIDVMSKFAESGRSSIFLPSSLEGSEDVRTQILSSLEATRREAPAKNPAEANAPSENPKSKPKPLRR
jgi:regulator of protease activity HflC (stomatin/prohibitin superfamily)